MKGDVEGDNGRIGIGTRIGVVIFRCGFPNAINVVNGDTVFVYYLPGGNQMRVRFEGNRCELITVLKPGALIDEASASDVVIGEIADE